MKEVVSGFTLVSGVISEDSEHQAVNIPLSDNFTLVCGGFELSRGNKLAEIALLSQDIITKYVGADAMTLKAGGEVSLDKQADFIAVLNEICCRKVPFILNVGGLSFEKMLLKSYIADIDKFGVRAKCSLVFVQV